METVKYKGYTYPAWFGKNILTFIKQTTFKCKHPKAIFLCECGVQKELDMYSVRNSVIKNCGCKRSEISRIKATRYSHNIKKLNSCHRGMMSRCYNEKNVEYKNYGGRGVTVCGEWHNYQNFLNWALNNGWNEALQLDKDKIVKDNKIYSPETCCFITARENTNHRRNTVEIFNDGKRYALKELCELEDLNYNIIQKKIKAGVSFYVAKYQYLTKTKYAT